MKDFDFNTALPKADLSKNYTDLIKSSSWTFKMPDIPNIPLINREELADERNEKLIGEIRGGNEKMVEQLELANTSLDKLNQNLESQLSSVHNSLNMILNAIGSNAQQEQRELIEIRKSIAELQILVECQDENGIKKFIENHGIESVGLILQFLSMFILPK